MINCIITSRMSSKRLPEKALHQLQGKPMLRHVHDRLLKCKKVSRIIVATSVEKDDDAIADYCNIHGISVFRGSLNDVSKRLIDCVYKYPCDAFVRISGDSPLIDPKLVDKVIEAYSEKFYDLCTNVFVRTYPKGQSVEVIRTKTFLRAQKTLILPTIENMSQLIFMHTRVNLKFKILKLIQILAMYSYQLMMKQILG